MAVARELRRQTGEEEVKLEKRGVPEPAARVETPQQFQDIVTEERRLVASTVAAERNQTAKRADSILGPAGLADDPEARALIARQQSEIIERGLQAEKAIDQETGEKAEGAPTEAASLLERSLEGREVRVERTERAREMAQRLDAYVSTRIEVLISEAILDEEKKIGAELSDEKRAELIISVRERAGRARDFFVTIDTGKRPDTPLERMAQTYEYLDPGPKDPTVRAEFDAALSEHMQELVERAFDQHLDNPEQYVSHGFDHSLNVADYAKDIIELNDPIVDSTAEKYGLSKGEAKFMLEQVALLHDCGYPHVGEKAKAVHGIAGADLVSSPKMQKMFERLITTPGAKKDKLNHDLRDSILFHSADKVEKSFSAKIETTRGTFLTEGKDIVEVLSTFNDPEQNPAGVPRDITEIFVSDEDTKREIEAALAAANQDTTRKTGSAPFEVKITLTQERFRGRFADLVKEKDNKLGLEYSEVDATETPLHSIIRLADNMDMRANRFSPIQREPAFRDIYQALGDNREASQIAQELEALAKKAKKEQISPEVVQSRLRALLDRFKGSVPELSDETITGLESAAAAEKTWKKAIIESILSKSEHTGLSDDVKDTIRKIASAQNSESMRHFGGCEAIRDVKLETVTDGGEERSVVIIRVDRKKYEEMNLAVVTEKSLDANGVTNMVDVGVGEYQVWRAEEAYRSIAVSGKKVEVRIVDEADAEIVPTYRRLEKERMAIE